MTTGKDLYNKIRMLYPNPVSATDDFDETGYCVGGAAVMYHMKLHNITVFGYLNRFPYNTALMDKLIKLNPSLDSVTALRFVGEITDQNDNGEFELAWTSLYAALTYA